MERRANQNVVISQGSQAGGPRQVSGPVSAPSVLRQRRIHLLRGHEQDPDASERFQGTRREVPTSRSGQLVGARDHAPVARLQGRDATGTGTQQQHREVALQLQAGLRLQRACPEPSHLRTREPGDSASVQGGTLRQLTHQSRREEVVYNTHLLPLLERYIR